MKKSIASRVKITRTGKIRRQPKGLGHSRANKSRKQVLRKRGWRGLNLGTRTMTKILASRIGN